MRILKLGLFILHLECGDTTLLVLRSSYFLSTP